MLAQPRLRLPTAGGTFPPRPKGGASKFISSGIQRGVGMGPLSCRQHASLLRMKTAAAAGAWRREAGETHLCYDGHVRPDDP